MTAPWSERREIADQVDEANADARDEVASQRNEDAHLIWDDTPSRAECEAADFDDWRWGREQRPDPWGDPPPTPRVYPPTPTDPPF